MKTLTSVILAAGLGKRMHSDLPKALQRLAGRPMLDYVMKASDFVEKTICVVGHRADLVEEEFKDRAVFVNQPQQLGTGHAVKCAEAQFGLGDVLVLFTDTPLITAETLKNLLDEHRRAGNSATLITAEFDDPGQLGRIVRDGSGNFKEIVEFKNADDETKKIREINSGLAVFDAVLLREKLELLSCDNPQGEYLLTDVFSLLLKDGKKVGTIRAKDPNEVIGVNDRYGLALAEEKLLERIKKNHMLRGVSIHMPSTVYIEPSVELEPGAVIEQGTRLLGSSFVGSGAVVGPFSELRDSSVGSGTVMERSLAVESTIGKDCKIGPFAYLRPSCKVEDGVKVGDFVEVKNSLVRRGAKLPHLSYIGDGEVGERTNIGCGTIFVNYDGEKKHRTVVGSDSFIGCNANLVAPVTVGDDAFVAAGTTVTEDVPDSGFAISRVKQENRPNKKSKRK